MTNDLFTVELTRAAEKDRNNLRPHVQRVNEELLKLEDHPDAGHSLSGNLSNVRSLEFSLPGGAYRAAYVILEAERVCLVFMVAAHEGFYEEAARRWRAVSAYERVKARRRSGQRSPRNSGKRRRQ